MPPTSYVTLLSILIVRYLIVAGGAYLVFSVKRPARWETRRIQEARPDSRVVRRELFWSLSTSLIFAFVGKLVEWADGAGLTLIYTEVEKFGWLYFFASVGIYMVIHDTYFYWTHRWMHSRLLFKWVHRVHHDSRTPTALAAFSFHPLEAVIEAGALPLLVFLVPIHPAAFLIYLMVMTVISVINHIGYEIYPKWFARNAITRWIISATHHDLHHQTYTKNLGLYFNWWDRWLGTQAAQYEQVYDEVCGSSPPRSEPFRAAA